MLLARSGASAAPPKPRRTVALLTTGPRVGRIDSIANLLRCDWIDGSATGHWRDASCPAPGTIHGPGHRPAQWHRLRGRAVAGYGRSSGSAAVTPHDHPLLGERSAQDG